MSSYTRCPTCGGYETARSARAILLEGRLNIWDCKDCGREFDPADEAKLERAVDTIVEEAIKEAKKPADWGRW